MCKVQRVNVHWNADRSQFNLTFTIKMVIKSVKLVRISARISLEEFVEQMFFD